MPSRQRPFKEDKQFFVEQVNEGQSCLDQAKFWKCSVGTIRNRRKEFDCFDYIQHKNKCNQYRTVQNQDIFNEIDNEHKAYWLGFLYADGSVAANNNRIELCLAAKDLNHLIKFKDFIGIDNKISYRSKTNAYRYSFRNKKIKQDLIKQGCIPQKSLKLKFPNKNQVPNYLIHHFMRGYLDGDGYITHTDKTISMGFIGTQEFILSAVQVFNLKPNKICDVHRKDGAKRYQLSAKQEMKDFLYLLYHEAKVYLDRKYEKYLSLI